MIQPETLVRLRPWIFRLLVAALVGGGILGLLANLNGDIMEAWSRVLASLVILAIGSISALNCISYTRRRERTGPTLIGLVLVAAAAAGLLATVWITAVQEVEEVVGNGIFSLAILALTWTFLLAVYSERLPARHQFIQRATAAAIAALGLTLVIGNFRGVGEPGQRLAGSLGLVSLVGLLVVIALAHHYRSGVRALVPMAHVASVARGMDFYKKLGFRCENFFAAEAGAEPTWAWMESPGGAQLMLTCAEEPVAAAQQGVLFYIYCDDLPAKHAQLLALGIAAGPIEKPFYAPRGEFRVTDPDGYALMLTHT